MLAEEDHKIFKTSWKDPEIIYLHREKVQETLQPPSLNVPFVSKQTQNKQIQKQIIWHCEHLASVKS